MLNINAKMREKCFIYKNMFIFALASVLVPKFYG
jgi:hypothetical protein